MADLVIVESPGKTRKINQILGSGYVVRASLGHVRDLPQPKRDGRSAGKPRQQTALGLDIAGGWKPTWEIIDSKAKVVRELRSIGRGGVVWLATDLDREGEAIAWHLRDLLGGSEDRFRRVTFSEITPAAVRAAFESPRGIDYDLVRAQQARRFLDRVVGFTVSPLLSRRLRAGLSAGRVQSAALAILAARDEKIRVFAPEEFFGVDVLLAVDGADPVRASLVDADGGAVRFAGRAEADALAAHLGSVAVALDDVVEKDASQRPKPPFTTSTLQQAASSLLKLSVSDTMAIAQKLYEAGKITYMRSDSVMVAPEAQEAARSWLTAAFGEGAVPAEPPRYESKEGSQEAHEAIRPTDPAAGAEGIDPAHAPLYDLIRRRLLASQMTPARIRRTTWKLSAPGASGEPVRLEAKGRVVVDPGFHRVLPPALAADEPPAVPALDPGTVWAPGSAEPEVSSSWTKPPPRYTEASLVAELESAGVGRPSTYANTLKTLVDRGYVLLDGRVFVVTPLGRLVCGRLRRHFPKVTDVGFTADLESRFDEVASGRAGMRGLLDGFYGKLRDELSGAEGDPSFVPPKPAVVDWPCPRCKGPTAVLLERGRLVLACRTCPDPAELAWAPKKARRRAAKQESSDKAASEQAAADQRLQARCGVCGGAQQRWKVAAGGYVHLCAAWPACGGVAVEAGRGGSRGTGSRTRAAAGRRG